MHRVLPPLRFPAIPLGKASLTLSLNDVAFFFWARVGVYQFIGFQTPVIRLAKSP